MSFGGRFNLMRFNLLDAQRVAEFLEKMQQSNDERLNDTLPDDIKEKAIELHGKYGSINGVNVFNNCNITFVTQNSDNIPSSQSPSESSDKPTLEVTTVRTLITFLIMVVTTYLQFGGSPQFYNELVLEIFRWLEDWLK